MALGELCWKDERRIYAFSSSNIMKKMTKGRCSHCHFGTRHSHVGVSKINEDSLDLLAKHAAQKLNTRQKNAILNKQCVICILQMSSVGCFYFDWL